VFVSPIHVDVLGVQLSTKNVSYVMVDVAKCAKLYAKVVVENTFVHGV